MHTYTYTGPREGGSAVIDRLQTIYVRPEDRYVVSLIVGYREACADDTTEWPPIDNPRAAAFWALRLTRDQDSPNTVWCVYDRVKDETILLEQADLMAAR
jgi:hypothetical protein